MTVTDVAVGEAWSRRVFGLQRVMVELAALGRSGVPSSGITVRSEPLGYALIVVRDPDEIQREITWS